MKKLFTLWKEKMKEKDFLIRFIILSVSIFCLVVSLFFTMLYVYKTITSIRVIYTSQLVYEYRCQYTTQCGYQFYMGIYQYVCTPKTVCNYVPTFKYVPQYMYYSTFFRNDVHLYDMILSSFYLNSKQLFFVIPILLILCSGSFFCFTKKHAKIGHICLSMLTILLSGSFLGVFRLFIKNTSSCKLGFAFFLVFISVVGLVFLCCYHFKLYTPKNEDNQHWIKDNKNYSYIFRFVLFILLLLLSEISVTTIYGFLLYLFMIVSLILSYQNNKKLKIFQITSASMLLLYYFIMTLLVLFRLPKGTSFFDVLSFWEIMMCFGNITIFILSLFLFLKEKKLNLNR